MTKRKQLLTCEDSVPSNGVQHKKCCSDCPFARTALAGWLADMTADEWLMLAHSEGTSECHVFAGADCAGLAIYRANVLKQLRDKSALELPSDHKKVFSTPMEFKAHHERKK